MYTKCVNCLSKHTLFFSKALLVKDLFKKESHICTVSAYFRQQRGVNINVMEILVRVSDTVVDIKVAFYICPTV